MNILKRCTLMLKENFSERALFLKIFILKCCVTILICSVASHILYKEISSTAYKQEVEEMSYDSNSIRFLMETTINQAKADVKLLSYSTEFRNFIKAPNSNSKKELSSLFIKLLDKRGPYFQVRYIGIQNNGKEIIRAERDTNGTPYIQEALQEKGDEYYFIEALNSNADVYISRLDYNREKGRVEIPRTPVIRAIKVIKDETQKPLGIIVINTDYSQILETIVPIIAKPKQLRIYNREGDYIHYDSNTQKYEFQLNEYNGRPDDYLLSINNTTKEKKSGSFRIETREGKQLVYYQNFAKNELENDHQLTTIISHSLENILKPAKDARGYIFSLGMAFLILAWILTLWLTNSYKKALSKIDIEITNYSRTNEHPELPTNRLDEIGKLARAIDNVIIRLENTKDQERQTKEHLQATIDTALDAIITIDDLAIIQTFNPSAERMFGYDKEEVIGKNVNILMPEPYKKEHDGYVQNYKNTGHAKIIGIGREVTGLRKNGETFPMELGVNRMTLSGQFMFVGTIRDITERKQVEEEMIRSNEELERFAYVASHDLREPLRIISSFTEILEDQYKENLDEKGHQCMDFILEAANRMQDMINDLLDYSRAGADDSDFEEVDCNETIKIVETNLMEPIELSKAVIKYKNLPIINVPPVRIARLFQNIIGNAIKYRNKEIPPEIIIKAAEKENDWLFTIKDNGIGMKQEHLDKIFIIFQRLHKRDEYTGTGIGLAICKRIVESFGGNIWAESAEGEGSTFYFTIPKKEIEEDNSSVTYAFK